MPPSNYTDVLTQQAEICAYIRTQTETSKEILKILQSIDDHFSNGFRAEFKKEIRIASEKAEQGHKEMTDKLNTLISPGFWIKMGIVAVLSISSLVATIITFT